MKALIICSSMQVQGPQLGLPPSLPNRPSPGHPLYHYVVNGPHAIAVYDYDATQEGDLSFKVRLSDTQFFPPPRLKSGSGVKKLIAQKVLNIGI